MREVCRRGLHTPEVAACAGAAAACVPDSCPVCAQCTLPTKVPTYTPTYNPTPPYHTLPLTTPVTGPTLYYAGVQLSGLGAP